MNDKNKIHKIEELKNIFSHGLIEESDIINRLSTLFDIIIHIVDYDIFETSELKNIEESLSSVKRITDFKKIKGKGKYGRK
jgi:hypothetical protein